MNFSPELNVEEYRALRATIRERGSLRMLVVVITFVAWAALTVMLETGTHHPVYALPPLAVLVAGFEVVFALHVGVERIGRYVQVRFEAPAHSTGWEQTSMNLGRQPTAATGVDALFSRLFGVTLAANLALIALPGLSLATATTWAFSTVAVVHLLAAIRIVRARRFAAWQRERDLALIEQALRART
jgi:hypothetical protein